MARKRVRIPLRRGIFTQFGYKSGMKMSETIPVLRRAVRQLGGLDVFKRLIALSTMNKRNPIQYRKWRNLAQRIKREFYSTTLW